MKNEAITRGKKRIYFFTQEKVKSRGAEGRAATAKKLKQLVSQLFLSKK